MREIRTRGTKGKVPLPHAELLGNMDPKLDLSSHVMRTFVGYATAPGSLADAGNSQCPNNSPFTYALKDCLKNRVIASQVIQPFLKYICGRRAVAPNTTICIHTSSHLRTFSRFYTSRIMSVTLKERVFSWMIFDVKCKTSSNHLSNNTLNRNLHVHTRNFACDKIDIR